VSSSGGQSVEGREARSGLRAAASPVAAVLILAGIFHFYRGVPGEGVLFVAVGLAIAADAAGWLPSPRSRVFRLPGPTVSFAVAVVVAAALTMLTPHGAAETVVLAVIGVAVILIGWLQPVQAGGRPSQFSSEFSGGLTGEVSMGLKSEFTESLDSSGGAAAERSRHESGAPAGESPDDASRTAVRYQRTAVVWCCFGIAVCLVELAVYLLSDPPLREFQYPTLSTLLEPMVALPVGRLPLLAGWIVLGLALLRWAQGATGRSTDSRPDGAR
jgi:hypothetical protein